MALARPLVTLDHLDVVLSGARILRDLTLVVREGEGLAILGANGSGKSTLLRLLRGDLWPDPRGAGERLFHGPEGPETSPIGARERFGLVTPEAQDAYVRRDWDLPVEAVIRSGFFDALWPADAATAAQSARVREIAETLGVAPLLGRSFLALSRGEGRRVLLARALAPGPQALFLDEAADGLDRGARAAFLDLLSQVARAGTTLVMATHREAEIVPEIRRVARLSAGRIVEEGPREEVLRGGRGLTAAAGGPLHPDPVPRRRGAEGEDGGGRSRGADGEDASGRVRAGSSAPASSRVLFSLRSVDLLVDGRKVLAGVDWTMRAGERWAILGPNGAGKSTLLRLLAGEEHPSSGEVDRLGLGPRASVWDVKAHVSLVSAELQARHRSDATGEEVVLSGFAASIGLAVEPTARERASACRWIDRLGLSALASRHVASLSYGELRKLLLARALVTDPEVLLLDEPVSGLDPAARAWTLDALDRLARAGTALVLVTHHDDELVPSVDHVAVLEVGRLVRQGPR